MWTVSTLSGGGRGRTAYHHGDLKNALVDAGVAAARLHGPQAVQIRDLARQVGVSHNAAYRHFASRDDLLAAVAARGFAELSSAMRDALAAIVPSENPGDHARQRLREIGRAYVRFAMAEPGLFKATWAGAQFPPPDGSDGTTVNPYWILAEVLDDLVASGVLPEARRARSEFVALSAVHGFSMLVIEGPLGALPASELELALERLFDVVDAGL